MAKITVYRDILPNYNDNIHFFFSDFGAFKETLEDNILYELNVENYRINGDVLKIKLGNEVTALNFATATYVINDIDNCCYHITDCTLQSGYVIYQLAVDYWGTFIDSAIFKYIYVNRANAVIPNEVAYYDSIKITRDYDINTFEVPVAERGTAGADTWKAENVFVVFELIYNTNQLLFGSTATNGLFGIRLSQLELFIRAHGVNTEFTNIKERAIEAISGIYGIIRYNKTDGSPTPFDLEAQVGRIWLVPKELAGLNLSWWYSVKSKCKFGDLNEIPIYSVYSTTYMNTINIQVDPDYKYYVGTMYDGIELPRAYGSVPVKYRSIITQNDIQIIVGVGDIEKDISKQFEAEAVLNNGTFTQLGKIGKGINVLTNTVSAITNVLSAQADPSKLARGFASIEKLYNEATTSSAIGNQIGAGDAISTYGGSRDAVQYPYGYATYKSTDDEKLNTLFNGLIYNAKINSFDYLLGRPLAVSIAGVSLGMKIQATTVVEGIPLQAVKVIQDKLNNGIFGILV